MAKIKLIESLRIIKRTTIGYNGLKIRLLLTGSLALKSIGQLIVVIFPLKDIFKPAPFPPFFKGSFKVVLFFKCSLNLTFTFFWPTNGGK